MKKLLIIFVKNPELGKVKTRLASSIGDEEALKVYRKLLSITEKAAAQLNSIDVRVYFTSSIDKSLFKESSYYLQSDGDLGEKMMNSFNVGFEDGYNQIVGIGSDLPDLSSSILEEAFEVLNLQDTVFGPAKDGGYYLLGMKQLHRCIFENKPWSTEQLLNLTLKELEAQNISSHLLQELNDIDTIEDLEQSSLRKK